MRLQIISVAQKMPDWVEMAWHDYGKRLPRELKPELISIPLASGRGRDSADKARQREADSILQRLQPGSYNLALDERGDTWSSRDWSRHLQRWLLEYPRVNVIIGGPDGLDQRCLEHCQQRVSLGRMTMPHALVRVVLLEQLYRAWSILQGHPYHRD